MKLVVKFCFPSTFYKVFQLLDWLCLHHWVQPLWTQLSHCLQDATKNKVSNSEGRSCHMSFKFQKKRIWLDNASHIFSCLLACLSVIGLNKLFLGNKKNSDSFMITLWKKMERLCEFWGSNYNMIKSCSHFTKWVHDFYQNFV